MPRRKGLHRRWMGVLGAAAVLMAAAVVIFVQLGKTMIRLEINDPSLAVRFGDGVITVDNDGEPIHIKPGEKNTFTVVQNGQVIDSRSFELTKGQKVVLSVAVSSEGAALQTTPKIQLAEETRQQVRSDLSAQKPRTNPNRAIPGTNHGEVIAAPPKLSARDRKMAVSKDRLLIAQLVYNDVKITDTANREVVAQFRMEVNGNSVMFSDEGKELGVLTDEGVRYYSVRDGRLLRLAPKATRPTWGPAGETDVVSDTPVPAADPKRAIVFSADGKLMAILGHNLSGGKWPYDSIEVQEFNTGKIVKIINVFETTGRAVAFTAEGKQIAFFADEGVRFYDLRTGHLTRFLPAELDG